VRQCIHPARRPEIGGHRLAQLGAVDHRARHHGHDPAGGLDLVLGLAPDGRHLAAAVGGRDGQDRQAGTTRHGLGRAEGRSTTNSKQQVRLGRSGQLGRLLGHVDGHVLLHPVDDPDHVRLQGTGQYAPHPGAARIPDE
jgi:hypothetical protein